MRGPDPVRAANIWQVRTGVGACAHPARNTVAAYLAAKYAEEESTNFISSCIRFFRFSF